MQDDDVLDTKSKNLKAIINEYFTKVEDTLPNLNRICQVCLLQVSL